MNSEEGEDAVAEGHLDRLAPAARRVLRVASVLDQPFLLEDVAEVLSESVGALLAPLEEIVAAGWFVTTAAGLEFSSDRVRLRTYTALPRVVRSALHRQIGAMYVHRGGATSAAAGHLLTDPSNGDLEVLGWLDRIVSETISGAAQLAANVARRAYSLTATNDPARVRRGVVAARALKAAGRLDETLGLGEEILTFPDVPRAQLAELRLVMAEVYVMKGLSNAADQQATLVLEEPGISNSLHPRAEAVRLLVLVTAEDFEGARSRAHRILSGRSLEEDGSALTSALAALGFVAWNDGMVEAALGLFHSAVDRASQDPIEARSIFPRFGLARRLIGLGIFHQAESLVEKLELEIELSGEGLWRPAPTLLRSMLAQATGDLPAARVLAEQSLSLSEDAGLRVLVPLARFILATASLHAGDIATAASQMTAMREESGHRSGLLGSDAADILGSRIESVEYATAVELTDIHFRPDQHRRILLDDPGAAPWLVRTALDAGRPDVARGVAETVAHMARINTDYSSLDACAKHARGLVDSDVGLLSAASQSHGHVLLAAAAREDAGWLAATGPNRAEGVAELEEARAAYERIGAHHDMARVSSRLRSLGIRRRGWKPTERPVSGWASLTEAEMKVAIVVSEGLTNTGAAERLFVSKHTVDSHLRHIYAKLAVHSRVELTRYVLEQSDPDQDDS